MNYEVGDQLVVVWRDYIGIGRQFGDVVTFIEYSPNGLFLVCRQKDNRKFTFPSNTIRKCTKLDLILK